jgi:hypothetical protein
MNFDLLEKNLSEFDPKNNKIDDTLANLDNLLSSGRSMFALSMLLPLDSSLKGLMMYKLLENKKCEPNFNYEPEMKIIFDVLKKEDIEKSLKNLLILKQRRVNNARAKRIILEFIFSRDLESLENISIRYKNKISSLISHALGHTTIWNILNGNKKVYDKSIAKYINHDCTNVLNHLFNRPIDVNKKQYFKINDYHEIKTISFNCPDIDNVNDIIDIIKKKNIPKEVILGLRNFYKLSIPLNLIFEIFDSPISVMA